MKNRVKNQEKSQENHGRVVTGLKSDRLWLVVEDMERRGQI